MSFRQMCPQQLLPAFLPLHEVCPAQLEQTATAMQTLQKKYLAEHLKVLSSWVLRKASDVCRHTHAVHCLIETGHQESQLPARLLVLRS